MTMPASGTIRMSQINTELGRSSTASISLDYAEDGGYAAINTNSSSRPSASNPASLSEWYSYNHNAPPPVSYNYYTTLIQNDPCTYNSYDIYRRSDNNYFYYWNGSEYVAANGYWFSYAYVDYYDGLYYYDQYYVQNASMFSQGQTGSYCSP